MNRSQSIRMRGREAGFFNHRPTSGTAREWVLREPLHEALPAKYGVTAGEARAANGAVSGQWDVLIYDRLNTPTLFTSEGSSVLPIEGVIAAISVKSTVDKDAIYEAADAAEQLHGMPRDDLGLKFPRLAPQLSEGPRPAVFVFGFEGLALPTLLGHVKDACQGIDSPRRLSGVFILDTGFVAPVNGEGNVSPRDIRNYNYGNASEGTWGVFLGVLWNALTSLTILPSVPNMLAHISAGDLLDGPETRL